MHTAQSPFFHVLFEQLAPVGSLGRGTHYSVYRSVQWHHSELTRSDRALFHDVALVWDEDHDERLIDVLTRIHVEGLLPPILFVGERKGVLTILLNDEAVRVMPFDDVQKLKDRLADFRHVRDDVWTVNVSVYDPDAEDVNIINADAESVGTYLAHIDVLWHLGIKPISAEGIPTGDQPELG